MSNEPWQIAEVAGTKKAQVIAKPAVISAMIKKAKHPLMIVGHKAAEIDLGEEKAIDYMIKISKKYQVPIVATAHTICEFIKRDFDSVCCMPAVDIANRLRDPDWEGLDGKGQYDLALFVGIPYYMEWTLLSGLKHAAPNLKSVSLDRYYQPNATWSFPNIQISEWVSYLNELLA